MWGVIPAAGMGSRIQPLAFSKELLPVGSRFDGETERPRAVSEYLIERMVLGGAKKICFVISQGKSDILEYYGSSIEGTPTCYVVQRSPAGLCDAIFQSLTVVEPDKPVVVGLPDTIWFPENALRELPDHLLSFLLFPVSRPELFDAVVTDESGNVEEIQVKRPHPDTSWIWGAFKMPGRTLADLHKFWLRRGKRDEYMGTLVNSWLEVGNRAVAIRGGSSYVDVGTLNGYREAIQLLSAPRELTAYGHAPAENDPATARPNGDTYDTRGGN